MSSRKRKCRDDVKVGKSLPNSSDVIVNTVKSKYFKTDNASSSGDAKTVKTSEKLGLSFYDKQCDVLAKHLLGKTLVRTLDSGERLSGVIVETEAYLGRVDKAAHSYKGKTEKNEAMFMDPGTAYVYNIYGMYCCMNISSKGEGCAVLIRSLEPKEGIDIMEKERSKAKKDQTKKLKHKDFCNGPSKLCQSLHITKNAINKLDMTSSDKIWLEDNKTINDDMIVVSKRININYAEDWVDKPLRFYVLGNQCVSVKDKEAEKAFE